LLATLAVYGGSAWAVSGGCVYSRSGTGMGGTGSIAEGVSVGKIAGNIILSQGAVQAQSGEYSRSLGKGDAVCVGETIVTAKSGSAKIKMADDGMVTVRPQTKFKIEKFVYRGTRKDNSLFALLRGALRVVTGKIGHRNPQNDLISTPTATIGVRGTDHEATVILSGGKYPAGTYDKVNTGVTFIKTERGEVDIHPNQVGFVANPGDIPALLKEMPEFYGAEAGHRGGASEAGGREAGEAGHGGVEHPGEHGVPEHSHIEKPEAPEVPEGVEVPETPEGSGSD
jgi:hypothetical protein